MRVTGLLLSMLCAFSWLTPALADAGFAKISDNVSLHYEAAGDGATTVLFVPGWTMSTAVYERQLAHFAGSKTYRFITYDPRSQGTSTHTLEGNYYEQHGRDLKAFIDRLGLKNIVLAGWSFGSLDVMAYVHAFGTDGLKGLVLIDGPPKTTGIDNTKEWVWYRSDDSDGSRQGFTMPFLRDRQAANLDFAKWLVDNPTSQYLSWIINIMNQTPDSVAALLNETGAYLNYEADLKALDGKMPLLYVVRQEEGDLALNWSKANTPSATVSLLGKHMMFWDHSAEFNSILDAYLVKVK